MCLGVNRKSNCALFLSLSFSFSFSHPLAPAGRILLRVQDRVYYVSISKQCSRGQEKKGNDTKRGDARGLRKRGKSPDCAFGYFSGWTNYYHIAHKQGCKRTSKKEKEREKQKEGLRGRLRYLSCHTIQK